MSGTIECPSCGAAVEAVALLARLGGFYPDTQVGSAACPSCAKWLDFRVAGESLELGWTYWAGSLHFEAMTSAQFRAIRIVGEGDVRGVELDGTTFRPLASGE